MKKNKIAQIIPALRLKRDLHYFDYLIPETLAKQVKSGQLVEIPFRNQIIKGVILNLLESTEVDSEKIKEIYKIVDPLPFLSSWQLELIKYLADYYFVSMAVLLKMIIPQIPKRSMVSSEKFLQNFKFLKPPQPDLEINNVFKNRESVLLQYFKFEDKIKSYLGLISKVFNENKQIVIICPQLINIKKIFQFLGQYAEQTSILLNDLPKNKYWQEWSKIKSGEVKLIIGTRSAIFAPFSDLGLIIIDEEDNENHKQEEPNPRYNAKEVALKLGELLKAKVVLAALTPSLNSLAKVANNEWSFFKTSENKNLPRVEIIDKKEEFKKGNYSIFSEKLQKDIAAKLQKKEQVFLFLNRKGTATSLQCRDCGYVAICPICKLALTYYAAKQLICHHCGHKQDLFLFCPKCQSPNIKLTGAGTEKVETEIKKIFPQAKIIKIDLQTPSDDRSLEDFEIIIGTQYAFDYLNWQKVGLVGVINADIAFYLPDYRSLEKSYNLLAKITSYLDDSSKGLIIQTSVPENYIFQALKENDYKAFYEIEMEERKTLNYPPFVQLIKLIYQSVDFNGGQKEINEIYEDLKVKVKSVQVIITAPLLAYTEQVRGRFRWQIIIKVLSKNIKLDFLQELPENVIIDVDPENLL